MADLGAVACLGEEPRGLAHQAGALQQLDGDALGARQEVEAGARLHAHHGAEEPQVVVAADEVHAVSLRAAVHDGPHHASGFRALREEIADQDGARSGEPAFD